MECPTDRQVEILREFVKAIKGLQYGTNRATFFLKNEIRAYKDCRDSLQGVITGIGKILERMGLVKQGREAFDEIILPRIQDGTMPDAKWTAKTKKSWFNIFCKVCEKPATGSCAKCDKAHYCGRECQAKDWSKHKPVCYW